MVITSHSSAIRLLVDFDREMLARTWRVPPLASFFTMVTGGVKTLSPIPHLDGARQSLNTSYAGQHSLLHVQSQVGIARMLLFGKSANSRVISYFAYGYQDGQAMIA